MRKLLLALLLLPAYCFGQVDFCSMSLTSHAPISLTGASNQTITGYTINSIQGAAGITLTNCSNITIKRVVINGGCTPGQDVNRNGIMLVNCSNITVDSCKVTQSARGVYVVNCTGGINVYMCQMQNLTGPYPAGSAVQFNGCSGANNSIHDNAIENLPGQSSPADAINIFNSNGTSSSPIQVYNNQIRETGTSASSISAGGILLGDGSGSWQVANNNYCVNTGHFCVGIATGTNMQVTNNFCYVNDPIITNGVAIQIANVVTGSTCSNITVSGNQVLALVGVANWIPSSGVNACSAVSLGTNNWNATNLCANIVPAVLIPQCAVPAPILSYSPNAYTFYVNTTISPINIINNGGFCNSFTVSSGQPNGILFNTTTAQFTGVPLFITPKTTLTVAGTNSGGQNATTVSFTIIDRQPNILFNPSTQVCTLGVPITAMSPSNSGGTIVSATCTPSLPPGLVCNPVTAVISGTPTALSAVTNYDIATFNSGGASHATVTLSVVPPAPAPPVVTYSPNSYTFPINVPISTITPISTGGQVSSYSISPSPPASLVFDTTLGALTGTPTINSSTQTYTITAHNISGNYNTPLTLTVITILPNPPNITYQPASIALQINVPSPVIVPINTGGTPTGGYAISPTLPSSMSIDPVTGHISGTPGILSNPVVYDVSASNAGGTGHFSLTLSIVAPSPGKIIRVARKQGVLVFPP